MKYCRKCKTSWEGLGQPGFRETCAKCNEDLHICLNCSFYDTSKPYSCSENIQEPVVDKEKYNFCELFRFSDRSIPNKPNNTGGKTKDQWNKLFKK